MTDRELIGKKRSQIMGFAALWVMLFHGSIHPSFQGIGVFLKIGYLGVDIFTFISGFSMWNSFHVSCNSNNSVFIKRRMLKILPTFLPFALVYLISYFCSNYDSFHSFVSYLFSKDFLIFIVTFRWYVPFILLCYSLSNVLNVVFSKYGYRLRTLAIIILVCFSISVPFIFLKSSLALMFLLRIPEYVLGWYLGGNKRDSVTSEIIPLTISTCIYIVYYWLLSAFSDEVLSESGLYWWPITLLIGYVVLFLAQSKFIDNSIMTFCGKYSLELYLWHVFFSFSIIDWLDKRKISFDSSRIIVNLITIIFACVFAFTYQYIISVVSGIIRKSISKYKEDK